MTWVHVCVCLGGGGGGPERVTYGLAGVCMHGCELGRVCGHRGDLRDRNASAAVLNGRHNASDTRCMCSNWSEKQRDKERLMSLFFRKKKKKQLSGLDE